jgi:hypothetical protein
MTMRFYDQQHRFYAGIDLHSRTMHLCVLDAHGHVVFDRNLPCRPDAFLAAITPFRADVVIGVECMFAWYWLADLCQAEKIPFLIGHALYMKAIHGGEAKNDRIDAPKIARLLRGGNFPLAYVYPKGMRETRDLLRRRNYFVRQRAALFTHLLILNSQSNLPPFPKKLSFAANRAELDIAGRFADASVQKSAAANLAVIDCLDEQTGSYSLFLFGREAMPLIDFRRARVEVRLAVVLELLGWRCRERRGEKVRGPCPVHRSTSPRSRSFHERLTKGTPRVPGSWPSSVSGTSRCCCTPVASRPWWPWAWC